MARTKQVPQLKANLSSQLSSLVLLTVIPMPLIRATLLQAGKQSMRERKLPMDVVVLLVIFMALYPDYNTRGVFEAMYSDIFPGLVPDKSANVGEVAISQARQRLGDKVMESLFDAVCRPMAGRETLGAWYREWRLMAVDGSVVNLPDERKILEEYPKHPTGKGEFAFPQLRYAALMEVGSRAYTKVAIGSDRDSEMSLAAKVEEALERGMLLMGDRYYPGVENIERVNDRGAAFLFRVKGSVNLKPERRLKDGSYLATMKNKHGRKSVLLRVVEYKVKTGRGCGFVAVRLATNILDPDAAPALELADLYSRRWNIETGFREIKSTLRMKQNTLRSKLPELARQEFWGVLLAHYAIKRIIHDAGVANGVAPHDISTKNTIHIIKQFAKGRFFFPQD